MKPYFIKTLKHHSHRLSANHLPTESHEFMSSTHFTYNYMQPTSYTTVLFGQVPQHWWHRKLGTLWHASLSASLIFYILASRRVAQTVRAAPAPAFLALLLALHLCQKKSTLWSKTRHANWSWWIRLFHLLES